METRMKMKGGRLLGSLAVAGLFGRLTGSFSAFLLCLVPLLLAAYLPVANRR